MRARVRLRVCERTRGGGVTSASEPDSARFKKGRRTTEWAGWNLMGWDAALAGDGDVDGGVIGVHADCRHSEISVIQIPSS